MELFNYEYIDRGYNKPMIEIEEQKIHTDTIIKDTSKPKIIYVRNRYTGETEIIDTDKIFFTKKGFSLVVDIDLKIEYISIILMAASLFLQSFSVYFTYANEAAFIIGIISLAFAGWFIINALTRYRIGWKKVGPIIFPLLWIGFFLIVPNKQYFDLTFMIWPSMCVSLVPFALSDIIFCYAGNLMRSYKKKQTIFMFVCGGILCLILIILAIYLWNYYYLEVYLNKKDWNFFLSIFIAETLVNVIICLTVYSFFWMRKTDLYLILYLASNVPMFAIATIFGIPIAAIAGPIQYFVCKRKNKFHKKFTKSDNIYGETETDIEKAVPKDFYSKNYGLTI